MNLIKQFFYFTKSKLITFLILSMALYYFMNTQNAVLGNYYTLLIQFIVLFTLYLFLNIFWFSFKSKKHFFIGLIILVLLIVTLQLLGNYSAQKRQYAYEKCLIETNSQSFNTEVMNCMSKKGFKYYR